MIEQREFSRLNVHVTLEAYAIIKAQSKRLGCGMGTVVTMLALDKQKEGDALGMLSMYKQAMEEQEKAQLG